MLPFAVVVLSDICSFSIILDVCIASGGFVSHGEVNFQ